MQYIAYVLCLIAGFVAGRLTFQKIHWDRALPTIIALTVTAVWVAVNVDGDLSANSTYVNGVMLIIVGFYFAQVARRRANGD